MSDIDDKFKEKLIVTDDDENDDSLVTSNDVVEF